MIGNLINWAIAEKFYLILVWPVGKYILTRYGSVLLEDAKQVFVYVKDKALSLIRKGN